jgi:hypothetical protein
MLLTTKTQDDLFWELVKEFDARLAALTKKKGSDYNRLADFPDYCPNGWRDSALYVWRCALRILNLMQKPNTASNETFDETLLDLANFARFTWALRQMSAPNIDVDEEIRTKMQKWMRERESTS